MLFNFKPVPFFFACFTNNLEDSPTAQLHLMPTIPNQHNIQRTFLPKEPIADMPHEFVRQQ